MKIEIVMYRGTIKYVIQMRVLSVKGSFESKRGGGLLTITPREHS